jgi:hypothetical protein
LERESRVARPREEVFDFFSRAENLERITPPWLHFRIRTPSPIVLRQGALIDYSLRIHGLPVRWRTRIEEWNPPYGFVDVQVRGPYRIWRHTHRFAADGDGAIVRDTVEYELPFGLLGRLAQPFVARDLEAIFAYRAREMAKL